MKKLLIPSLLAAIAVVFGTCAFLFVGERHVAARLAKLASLDDQPVGKVAPRLAISRQRTLDLCAQAVADLDRPDGSRTAAKRLGQALDLIHLDDDGTLLGYLISCAEEAMVLQSLQRIFLRSDVEITPFREELDGRLERMARADRIRAPLAREVAEFRRRSQPLAERAWMTPWRRIGELMESRRLANCWEESFRLVQASNPESRHSLDAFADRQGCPEGRFLLASANDSLVFRTRVELAHAALDLAERLKNSAAPSTSSPFQVVEAGDHVELRAEEALAALDVKPGDPGAYLLCWTIPH